jgi:L-lactate dehydrogenase complex protein LldG
MSSARDAMLQRVRQAVAAGNRAGTTLALPARGSVGYQGAGADLQRFGERLTAAGGKPMIATNIEAAATHVLQIVRSKSARRILLGSGSILDALRLPQRLRAQDLEVHLVDELDGAIRRDTFFEADLGISGVACAIAETGTLVMASLPENPRSLSLLPPVHIAVVHRDQIVADLFDLFADLEADKAQLPSCLTLITGPSKTGDIELKLVTGVHGPGEVHVVVLT